jgi:hypothetical protein
LDLMIGRFEQPLRRSKLRLPASLASLVLFAAICGATQDASCADNLLLNGDFLKGSGTSVDQWRTESWAQAPENTHYGWRRPTKGAGEITVDNMKPNDARYLQNLTLAPGWYRFTVMARTEDVGAGAIGATISIMEDGIMSADLRGTQDWHRLLLYLKVGLHGADVEVGCRLGGYSSLNTGHVFFRGAEATEVDSPGKDGPQFDLDSIRKAANGPPIGSLWSLIAILILFAGVATFGWMSFPLTTAPGRSDAGLVIAQTEALKSQRTAAKQSSPAATRKRSERRR